MAGYNSESDNAATDVFRDEYILSLRDLLRVIRKRLWVVVAVTVVLTGVGIGLTLLQEPLYGASTRILIAQEQGSNLPGNLGGDIQGLEQLTQTMAEGLNSRPLAETVIEQNNLQMTPEGLTSHLSAKQIGETQFIRVDFADPDPRTAQEVVNAVADVFSNQVYEVSPSANGVTATVWEPALVSDRPVSPEYVRNASVALLLGLILGIGLAFLVERFDERWRSPEELEERLGIPIFAGIPELKRYKTEALQHPDGDKNTRKELK